MSSVHLKEGESVNANNWKTEFGSNEAAKEMVEHVGKQCSHFVTEEHYKKCKLPRHYTQAATSHRVLLWS